MIEQRLQSVELNEQVGRLLGSQKAYLSFPQPHQIDPQKPQTIFIKCLTSGWGSGKTRVMILNGLMLSALYPNNEGLIARFHGKDLETSVIPLFFEVCPPSWVKRITDKGKTGMKVFLKNGSVIYFRQIHDSGGGAVKTRVVGANLGWVALDQIEEMTVSHLNAAMGRLRNPKAKLKMLLCTANPNGRDWHQKFFFPNWQPLNIRGGEFFRTYQNGNILGINGSSEENRIINGGFVQDDYFDNMIANMSPEWVERYIHGSFEDFAGKVFKGYTLESVHNINPFPIPAHWECVVGIDVGGSGKWGVPAVYADEYGNLIVTDGFNRATGRTSEVTDWIKTHVPWHDNRTTFVIDPENKLAAVELADAGIYTRIAQKAVHAGNLRTSGYFHTRRNVIPPQWFLDSQPTEAVERIKKFGCPRIFVFKTFMPWRIEHDTCIWDEKKVNQIKKTVENRFDLVEATRYVIMTRPEPSQLPKQDKYKELRAMDPLSAREAEDMDRRIASYLELQRGGATSEMFLDSFEVPKFDHQQQRKWEFD